nr:MAG TPA: hypothetical protein [Caudoviricetes sp.]
MQYGNIIPPIYPTGVFIQSIEQTQTSTEAGGKNIIAVTLTNHTQQHFEILNGAKGDTGDAAGIKEITASIDNGIGVPSVTVTATGTGAEKTVHFDFKNLKGETGNVALTEEVKQHISQAVSSANQYTDGAIEKANQRIDTGDTNTLQEAKTYTDQQVQAEAQARVQGDASMLADAKRYINDLLIKIFQNGYIQRPGMPSPLEDTSLHFEGYSWYEVNYDGNFFRAKGRNAKAFSSKKLTIEQIRNGDYIFQDDEQEDAVRNIKGSFKKGQGGYESFDYTGCSGVFQASDNHRTNDTATGVTVSRYDNTKQIIFDTSKDPNLKTAEENRSRNLTFTIWALVKDE